MTGSNLFSFYSFCLPMGLSNKHNSVRRLRFFVLLWIPFFCSAQTGSVGSPFTALGQARNVITPGVYYFNLSGHAFSTYVNNGWVLVASDSGGATTILPTVTALSNASRGVLAPLVLATFTAANNLQVSTSDGGINCTSSNAALISRLINDSALYMGSFGNDKINNASWTGAGQAFVRGAGASCAGTSLGTHLDSCLFWPCGDGNGMHWIPSGGYHHESFGAGEAANTVGFTLWAEANLVVLPITLSSFGGTLLSNNTVEIRWITESETNSDYFVLQKSGNGVSWSDISRVSARGNSSQPVSYTASDRHPDPGENYYRLEEVSIDGSANYSQIIAIADNSGTILKLYPNPVGTTALLQGVGSDQVKIYSIAGQDITGQIKQKKTGATNFMLDFALVPMGIYFIKAGNQVVKAVVK
jgi:hypothetical protein